MQYRTKAKTFMPGKSWQRDIPKTDDMALFITFLLIFKGIHPVAASH